MAAFDVARKLRISIQADLKRRRHRPGSWRKRNNGTYTLTCVRCRRSVVIDREGKILERAAIVEECEP